MNARLERIEGWAHTLLARPAAWLVYGLWLGAGSLVTAAALSWAWLRRWRHLPEGGVVATVVREGAER